MGANKFATMLHKNKTPKLAIILIYTLLEWILIGLLLLNGLFSYLISRFANFFGLKPPCVFCSRVDHLFGPRKSYGHLMCDAHASEISKLGFCSKHRNLAEASDMCEDCASMDRAAAVLSWMKRSEEGEKDLRCSCCDVILESGFYSPYLAINPSSWGVLDCTHDGNFDSEEVEDVDEVEDEGRGVKGGSFLVGDCDGCVKEVKDESLELIASIREEDGVLGLEERLIPVELIDSLTMMKSSNLGDDDDDDFDDDRDYFGYNLVDEDDTALDIGTVLEEERLVPGELIDSSALIEEKGNSVGDVDDEDEEDREYVGYNIVEKEDTSLDIGTVSEEEEEKVKLLLTMANVVEDELPSEEEEHQGVAPQTVLISEHAEGFGEFLASEEESKLIDVEANREISIGSEICDHEQIDLPQCDDLANPEPVCVDEQCFESYNVMIDKEQVTEVEPVHIHTINTEELNEVEEERMPETPTSIDSLHAFHKRFMFERRESGTESLDGSITSEIDASEILTVDRLKASLKAERKALSALYLELEEERSASAVAANQTMAMITRLQEEKAAMQMEALQYQRMMEEQSEYDQEALQLLNELMMKREREKQEIEKELEIYRKKVYHYEAIERRKAIERIRTSSSSSGGESDDLSFESHGDEECNYSHNESNQNTSVEDREDSNHLMTLDESLVDFEEERLSILEQLKALEEKLFSVDDDELKGVNGDYGLDNGFDRDLNTNGILHYKPKKLLPLFDATMTDMENEDEMSTTHENSNGHSQSLLKSTIDDHKRLAIAEEVDNVYERLQALEADREFLKHCFRSLKKGDKGMNLLQEILRHLHDLRNAELRVRNVGDALASLST